MRDNLAIHIEGVVQRRDRFKLGPLSLQVPQGCVTAIVGPNGSGKSSTFKLLLGLSKPDEGYLTMLGQRVDASDDAVLKRRIGYLSEEPFHQEDGMRGRQKADFVRQWYPDWNEILFNKLLSVFEVDPSLKLRRMSKGMRRKFELALIMAHEPELLLLDEPSSGLDPLAWKAMIDVFHRYMEPGTRTIVMATHIVEEVRRLADYIVFMHAGRVLGMYEKDELFSSWSRFFVETGSGLTAASGCAAAASEIPGGCQAEDAGGGVISLSTARPMEAERWLTEQGWTIRARRPMELDDIMEALIERDCREKRVPQGAGSPHRSGAG
ncbi:ABC transporter ATP-binding protein [Paenibacillus beijingensis]|uniref:ABC transporter n=1 Tax=Paenibacillus beijingensis TaxID=1126833 RepID=A0A0D5NKR5_9BACL|nr:ABC transporter ATP-binding protein [Paenibacillus beijingensis]AJY75523.1 ABC transporter [Paenibacillus beijingensis]